VHITGSNPLSTQDDVAAALAERGVSVSAWYGATPSEYEGFLAEVLDSRPSLLIDDGGDLVGMLHEKRPDQLGEIRGGAEETTTGLSRLRALESEGRLAFPMIAVNDAHMKHLFDNRYGTGQSTWDGIMRTTNLVIAGKTVVVAGYGWCGKGVAMRARGLGANVVVTEVDPVAANEALLEGFRVMPMNEAAAVGEIFVTVTGNRSVIDGEDFARMPDGAILANAGHFDVEIDKEALGKMAVSRRQVRRNIEEYRLRDGRRVYLLAEGRLVNLAAGDGHPVEIMDISFAIQALALEHVAVEGPGLPRQVLPVPPEIDAEVARLRLAAAGAAIDELTAAQRAYLASWQ